MADPTKADITGIPINYDNSFKYAGQYHPEGMFHSWLSSMLPSLFQPGGSITVNPSGTADVQRTIAHENVHALLNKINQSGQLDKLNASNPFYSEIAKRITAAGVGEPNQEAPAYVASGEAGQIGVPDMMSQQYIDYLRNQLFKLDPKLAQNYQNMLKSKKAFTQ